MTPNDLIEPIIKRIGHHKSNTNLTFTTPDLGSEDERCEALNIDDDDNYPGFFDWTNAGELPAWWALELTKMANDNEYWVEVEIRDIDPFEYPIRRSASGKEYYGVPDKLPYVERTAYRFQYGHVYRYDTNIDMWVLISGE